MSTLSVEPMLMFQAERGEEETLLCPYFRCATCGEPITDGDEAIAVMQRGEDGCYTGEVAVVHKYACDRFDGMPWRPLAELIVQLAYNSGVSTERLRGLLAAVEVREDDDA